MSNKYFIKSLLSVIGIVAVAWSVQNVSNLEFHNLMAQKMDRLRPTDGTSGGQHTEKARGPLTTSIALLGAMPDVDNNTYLLEATITSQKVVEGAHVKWVLPAGVQLVNGKLEQGVAVIAPNAPFKTQITLRQYGSDNKQIHLVATGSLNGTSFSSVSQYNSTTEGLLQAQKAEILRTLGTTPQNKARR